MSEFVKKTAFGYKPVSGGRSDPECTHVILTEGEYAKMLQQISSAEQEVRNTKYDADKEIRRAQIDAQRKIESIAYETAKKIESLEKALAAEQQESALLRGLNANLLRISRERANADRGLKPKKEHTGYVVMNTQEKKLQRKDRQGYYTITLWETVLQSPYSVDFTEEQARHQICEDLMQRKNGEAWELSKIGICEEPTPGDYPRSEYDEIMENGNILVSYQLRANYQARRGEKTGFWDIILVHQKPIPQVPKDMRP